MRRDKTSQGDADRGRHEHPRLNRVSKPSSTAQQGGAQQLTRPHSMQCTARVSYPAGDTELLRCMHRCAPHAWPTTTTRPPRAPRGATAAQHERSKRVIMIVSLIP